jgi:hypothetical protein
MEGTCLSTLLLRDFYDVNHELLVSGITVNSSCDLAIGNLIEHVLQMPFAVVS